MTDELVKVMKLVVEALLCNLCKGTGELWINRGKTEMPDRIACDQCGEARKLANSWARR
jgi:hypothetical protein